MLYGVWTPFPEGGQADCFGIVGKIFFGPQRTVFFEGLATVTAKVRATMGTVRSTEPSIEENSTMIFEGARTGEVLRGTFRCLQISAVSHEVTLARETELQARSELGRPVLIGSAANLV